MIERSEMEEILKHQGIGQSVKIGENGELIVGFFSLKLEFDGKLDTKVLRDAAIGLDGVVDAAAELYSQILGGGVKIKRCELTSVQSGSCDFQGLSLVIEQSSKVIEVLKTMDLPQLFLLCTTAVVIYAIHSVRTYKEKQKTDNFKWVDNSVHIGQIYIGRKLLKRCPKHKELAKLVADKLETIRKKQPTILRDSKVWVSKLTHPGDAKVTNIKASSGRPDSKPEEQVLMTQEEIKEVPPNLPTEREQKLSQENEKLREKNKKLEAKLEQTKKTRNISRQGSYRNRREVAACGRIQKEFWRKKASKKWESRLHNIQISRAASTLGEEFSTRR